jgi:hypothetical protein
MEYSPSSEDRAARLSSSPAGTPRLIQAPASPIRSVHLDMAEDFLHGLPDVDPPRGDFFESSSSEDDRSASVQAATTLDQYRGRRHSNSPRKDESSYLAGATASEYVSRCQDEPKLAQQTTNTKPATISDPSANSSHQQGVPIGYTPVTGQLLSDSTTLTADGFLKLTHSPGFPSQHAHLRLPLTSRSESWYDDESPLTTEARPLSIQAPGPGRLIHHSSQRGSTINEIGDAQQSAAAVAAVEATNETIRDIHTQTIQALLRNQKSLQAGAKGLSFLTDSSQRPVPQPPPKKRVSLAPPPIKVSSQGGSVPGDIVRTPYPFLSRDNHPKNSSPRSPASLNEKTVLALSIRRRGSNSSRPTKIFKLSIPAIVDAPLMKMSPVSDGTHEKHFDNLDFDDASFFREVRKKYSYLAGPSRFFSARTLQHIEISHSVASKSSYSLDYNLGANAVGSCTHDFPRSPRFLASRSLTESVSATELMKHYNNPRMGKARYTWVQWAHSLASTSSQRSLAPAPTADSPSARLTASKAVERDSIGGDCDGVECTIGFEFVKGWCAWRILLAVLFVVLCAIAAALCWIFWGTDRLFGNIRYKGAGGRVEAGCLLGVFVLMIGWSGVLGWVGLSWCVE